MTSDDRCCSDKYRRRFARRHFPEVYSRDAKQCTYLGRLLVASYAKGKDTISTVICSRKIICFAIFRRIISYLKIGLKKDTDRPLYDSLSASQTMSSVVDLLCQDKLLSTISYIHHILLLFLHLDLNIVNLLLDVIVFLGILD